MKKFILLVVVLFLITGCKKYGETDVISEINKKTKDSYMLVGELALTNNDDVYTYEVEVSYKKDNYYKVVLTNTSNNHTQIILKNDDGVYIITPMLNKSFKFQSEWPYNNSQIYLFNALINDIENDSSREFSDENDLYTFVTKVNYPNNKSLVRQKIVFDKNLDLKEVKVYDNNDVIKMELSVSDVDYSPTFKKDYFELDGIIKTFGENTLETTNLEDSIFPLFLPVGTKLANSEKINTDNGQRIIMTFDGDKPFLLVEEVANKEDEFTVVPTYGEPYMLSDTLGVMTDNSLSWVSSGIEYYIVSDVMSQSELIEVARSISVIPTMK